MNVEDGEEEGSATSSVGVQYEKTYPTTNRGLTYYCRTRKKTQQQDWKIFEKWHEIDDNQQMCLEKKEAQEKDETYQSHRNFQ